MGGTVGGSTEGGVEGVVPGPVRDGLSPPWRASRVPRGAKPGVKAEAVRVPPGGRGRGEDRRELKKSHGKKQYLNEGEYKLIFYFETAYDVLSMGDDENSRSFSLTGKTCLSK